MTLEELKQAVLKKWPTIKECAEELGVSYNTLQSALSGKNPLTKALKNHLTLALGKREAVLVYRVDIDTKKVEELTAGRGCVTEADHKAAMNAIIHSNLQELIRLGATLDWTPEERFALGLGVTPAEEALEKYVKRHIETHEKIACLTKEEIKELEAMQAEAVEKLCPDGDPAVVMRMLGGTPQPAAEDGRNESATRPRVGVEDFLAELKAKREKRLLMSPEERFDQLVLEDKLRQAVEKKRREQESRPAARQ